jgi:hypothetical protein
VRFRAMRTGIKFEVSPPDRLRLEQVVKDRNVAQNMSGGPR